MAMNPREALDRLIGALEAFHAVGISAADPESPAVIEAADALADAYTIYDDVMFTQFGVEAPLDIFAEVDDEYDDDDEYDYDEDDLEYDDDDLDVEDETSTDNA